MIVTSSDESRQSSKHLYRDKSYLQHIRRVEPNKYIRKGIWIYFILLIFEGALRKWILPGLATPLLIIRDPLAIALLIVAWKKGLLPNDNTMVCMMLIGVVSFFTGFYLGHGNLFIALYGSRVFFLHFPLIYIIGTVFTAGDVIKIGKVILWLSIPMTLLIAFQFYSPQSAWVNRGIGGDLKGGGFSGALGYFRPPGTFSFITGTAQFFSLTGAFIVFFWLNLKQINRMLIILATISLIAAIPLSISRTLLFSISVSSLFGLSIAFRKPKYFIRAIFTMLIVLCSLFFLGKSDLFENSTKAFRARFELANKAEGGMKGVLMDRFLGGMISELENSSAQPFFGYGSGMGTNAGAKLLTGKQDFLISEGEWGRLIGELGPILGLFAILLRAIFCFKLLLASYRRIHYENLLPWMLMSFAFLMILQGQWAQPTSLGFSALAGGLVIASLKSQTENGKFESSFFSTRKRIIS